MVLTLSSALHDGICTYSVKWGKYYKPRAYKVGPWLDLNV